METPKKPRGRPAKSLPERINATAGWDSPKRYLRLPPDHEWDYHNDNAKKRERPSSRSLALCSLVYKSPNLTVVSPCGIVSAAITR